MAPFHDPNLGLPPIVKYRRVLDRSRRPGVLGYLDDHPELLFVGIFVFLLFGAFMGWAVVKGVIHIVATVKRITASSCRGIKNKILRCFGRPPVSSNSTAESTLEDIELATISSEHDRPSRPVTPKPPGPQRRNPLYAGMPAIPPTAHAFYRRHGPHEHPPTYKSLYQRIEELQNESREGRFTNSRRTSQDETRYTRYYF